MTIAWPTARVWHAAKADDVRVALLHSFYSSAASSGENVVVTNQMEALAAAGHDVVLIGRETDREQRHLSAYPLRAAWRTLSSRGPDPEPLLRRFSPDVVHIHNTVPNIGLQWLPAWEGAVVHTLHNYRPLCANGLLLRNGALCTLCPDGHPWAAVEYGCYRESRVASLPIAVRNARGIGANSLMTRSDALVVLSEVAADIYAGYGVQRDRMHLIPNGIRDVHGVEVSAPPQAHKWLAVGRLSPEKGFVELLAEWPEGQLLDIVGDGPQREHLQQLVPPHVRLLGALPANEVRAIMPRYSALIFAGTAVESALPLVVGEALEAGLPVVFRGDHRQAGPLVAAGVARAAPTGGMGDALSWVNQGGMALRTQARSWYDQHLTVARWIERLEALYSTVQTSRLR